MATSGKTSLDADLDKIQNMLANPKGWEKLDKTTQEVGKKLDEITTTLVPEIDDVVAVLQEISQKITLVIEPLKELREVVGQLGKALASGGNGTQKTSGGPGGILSDMAGEARDYIKKELLKPFKNILNPLKNLLNPLVKRLERLAKPMQAGLEKRLKPVQKGMENIFGPQKPNSSRRKYARPPKRSQSSLNGSGTGKTGKRSFGKIGKLGKVGLLTAALVAIPSIASAATDAIGPLSSSFSGLNLDASGLAGVVDLLMDGMFMLGPIMGMVGTAISGVGTAFKVVAAIAMANPLLAIIAAIAAGAALIISNWDTISAFFSNLFNGISQTISKWIDGVISLLPGWLKKLLGIDGGATTTLPAAETAEKAAATYNNADKAVKNLGNGMVKTASGSYSGVLDKASRPNPGASSAAPQGSKIETSINGPINIYTQATDANGIAKDMYGALQNNSLVNTATAAVLS